MNDHGRPELPEPEDTGAQQPSHSELPDRHPDVTPDDGTSNPQPAQPTAREDPPRRGSGILHGLREIGIVVVTALVLSLIVKTFLFQAFWIPSGSMESTLIYGDRVVVSKLTPGPFALKRGDVVVFEDPDHWLDETPPPDRGPFGTVAHDVLEFVGIVPTGEGNHLIKRVIGLPGDHVVCCTDLGKLKINGTAINEPYVHAGDPPSIEKFDITVPPGKVWVMGDHRSDSGDSRFHDNGSGGKDGSVPEDLIVGRAVSIVWPLDRISWLSDYSDTFADVPDPKGSQK
ncbi:signal peptidase I [Segeticoccus rhizosphaerae]|uniref:signal peptidase I n=1 Tax=Segeticoccus rhizosphaerae TaxID=1104777 RepID=UPI001EE49DD6|nr:MULTISPECIES: signal peptidase I [Intrasporangiaceae]